MRARGDILLVSCYEPGHQPAGLASPAAFLRRAGYDPLCLDLAVEALDQAARARLARARLVAISAPMHTALALGLRVAARVRRENPDAHICFYGLYAVLNQRLLRGQARDEARPGTPPAADSVLGPESEEALVALADALAANLPAPAVAPTQDRPRRLALIAPDRSALPALARYARLEVDGERRVAGHVEATRGCKHWCRHCPIPPVYQGRFFAVPLEVVLADARQQIAAGARHIDFGDPDFLNGPKHALAVTRALHAEHPRVTFSFTTKVEHIVKHRALFPELRALGCLFVVSAVESLSDRVLAILDKGHTAPQVHEALEIVRGAEISLRPTFVAFTPWTSLDDYLALCRFVRGHQLENEVDPVQLSIRLLLPPGSLLLDRPEMKPHLGALDEEGLTYAWTHPEPRMDHLQAEVASLVEQAVRDQEAPAITFARVHELAARTAGDTDPLPEHSAGLPPGKPTPPRLTEPWFC